MLEESSAECAAEARATSGRERSGGGRDAVIGQPVEHLLPGTEQPAHGLGPGTASHPANDLGDRHEQHRDEGKHDQACNGAQHHHPPW